MKMRYTHEFWAPRNFRCTHINMMHDQLDAVAVKNVLIDPFAEKGEEKLHCFVAAERVDATANDAFNRLVTFIDDKTK